MRPILQTFLRNRFPISNPALCLPEQTAEKPGAKVLILSLLAAVAGALAAWGIWLGMNAINNLVFLGEQSTQPFDPTRSGLGVGIIAIPVTGVLVMLLVNRFTNGFVRAWLQPVLVVIGMGTGIPLGPEGAVAGVGEIAGKQYRLAGIAAIVAGIACLFGSPFAAVLLAVEILGVASAPVNILVLVLSGGIGYYGYTIIAGLASPVFPMAQDVLPASPMALAGYAFTGLITGLVAIFCVRICNSLSRFKAWWLPLGAALIIGISGYFAPEMLGPGWNSVGDLLNGKVTLWVLLVLSVIKFIAWLAAAGSKIPGGNMLPLMIMGGALGLFTALILQMAFPAVHLNAGVAALVGMMAMLASACRVWPAAIMLGLEITRQGHALLPLICAVTVAYGVSFLLARRRNEITG